jgi:1,4-alpha-glucan branching enzyme
LIHRALNQAARELMLSQSSDWAFCMTTGSHAEYAVNRVRDHTLAFIELEKQVLSGMVDSAWLSGLESKNNLFPDIDYRVFA